MNLHKRLKNSARLLQRSHFHYYRMAMLRPPFWLRANGRTCLVAAGDELGAGSCYSEVVVEDCYGLFQYHRHARPRVIVDIGANIGMFSKLCTLLFPDADIYAYEPNPSALKWLAQNAEGTRIRVIPCAVAEESGFVNLDTSCDSTIGRITECGNLPVRSAAASEVAEGRQIDLLKIDCEGSEFSILRDLSLLERTEELRLEFHLFDGHTLEELKELIAGAGHRIKCLSKMKEGGRFGVLRSARDQI